MSNVSRIARKEFAAFFSSVTAFLFLGAFLFVMLFVFFWVDPFFARNIADARPLFEWMPTLLILLVPALTMRMWSEERRSGTLELLMTSPVSNIELVLGKFFACLGLVAVAVALTIQIPITVGVLGSLDIGPVIGGYIASMFLAGAYIAIGLFVSAKTDNQIVSLLFSMLLCGIFLLIGSDPVVSIFSGQISDVLKLLGSGSRFQSITRGVIDLRDLYYYLSIIGIFLSLNVLGLERLRWAGNKSNPRHKHALLVVSLLIANFIAGNFWLQEVAFARIDITEGHIYTISDTTRRYLAELKEPLLLRGYFSKKTHPLLAPLVPKLKDLLNEYALAGKGKVKVEFVDPLEDPELEREAGEKYGVKPEVFQTASKYQASVVNSYFNVVVLYGDKHETLGYRDLIEVKTSGESDLDVELRNPEYDITGAIKKVLSSYRSEGNLFNDIKDPVVFKGYFSDDAKLAPPVLKLKQQLVEVATKIKDESHGKFSIQFEDPEADGGKLAKKLEQEYGFKPMALGIVDPHPFWLYMVLESGGQVVPIGIPQEMDKLSIDGSIKSALKRFSKGFLKTIGVWSQRPDVPGFEIQETNAKHFMAIRHKLGDEYSVKSASFEKGRVPNDIDILLLLAPEKLNETQIFAIDQFLMRGGTVIASTSPFDVDFEKDLDGKRFDSGMNTWLKHCGIDLEETMVLDSKNASFPIPSQRNIGEFVVQEMNTVPYPYFVDVRADGMDRDSGITSGLNQITMNWPSPIKLDEAKNKGNTIVKLLSSSKDSWTSPSTDIQPNFKTFEQYGFPIGADKGRRLLAVAVEGQFESFFKGKTPPSDQVKTPPDKTATKPAAEDNLQAVLDKSTGTSRLIVFASNSFLSDEMLELASASMGTQYLNPIDLVSNSIDWSLGDRDLLLIRGRGHFSRPLVPVPGLVQMIFEYGNYAVALFALFVVWIIRGIYARRARKRYAKILHLSEVTAQ